MIINKSIDSNTPPKRGRGRPRKNIEALVGSVTKTQKKVCLGVLFEPTIHDLQDELSRLDSYAYASYNN